jgi:hypothetical protein
MNGSTAKPVLVLKFEFKLKYNEKPLSVKYVPDVLYQNFNESPVASALFILNVIDLNVEFLETFNDDNTVTLLFYIVKPKTFILISEMILMKHYC